MECMIKIQTVRQIPRESISDKLGGVKLIYMEEYREGGVSSTGYADLSERIAVNSVGFYSTEEVLSDDPFVILRKEGRLDYLLCLVEKGTVRVENGEESFEVEQGAFLYRPDCPQSYYCIKTGDPLSLYWVHFTGFGVEELLCQCGMEGKTAFGTGVAKELTSVFRKLTAEMQIKAEAYHHSTAALVEYLLSLVVRYASKGGTLSEENSSVDQRIAGILAYIHTNYQSDLSVAELAKQANLSVSRFSYLFNESIRMFPKTYIMRYRISKACEMLRNTDFSVGQIGYFVGFHDPLYFSRIFKKYMQMPPSSYVQQYKSTLFE